MKVLVKAHVSFGDDEKGVRILPPGEVVEVDDETAKASPWAFEEQKAEGSGQ